MFKQQITYHIKIKVKKVLIHSTNYYIILIAVPCVQSLITGLLLVVLVQARASPPFCRRARAVNSWSKCTLPSSTEASSKTTSSSPFSFPYPTPSPLSPTPPQSSSMSSPLPPSSGTLSSNPIAKTASSPTPSRPSLA